MRYEIGRKTLMSGLVRHASRGALGRADAEPPPDHC
jgi:hypothetical protein